MDVYSKFIVRNDYFPSLVYIVVCIYCFHIIVQQLYGINICQRGKAIIPKRELPSASL